VVKSILMRKDRVLYKKQIAFFAIFSALSLPIVGANEFDLLSDTQTTNLKMAVSTGITDGHPRLVMPGIIYQESKAGVIKDHKTFIGIGQVSIIAAREVLIEHPAVSKTCSGITHTSPNKIIKAQIHNDDQCGIAIASKYLRIIREKYKITPVEQQIVAYQMGPIAAKRVFSSAYSRSVLSYGQRMMRIFRS